MSDISNFRLHYWESPANLKDYLSELLSINIPTTLATQISNNLTQGRLYFESASRAAFEIRPVLIYYGMVGFVKALILARSYNHNNECTLPQKHGLRDVSGNISRLDCLKLKVEGAGIFQLFNDTSRVRKVHLMEFSFWKDFFCLSSKSETINSKIFTLQDILSRIPGLETAYKDTFKTDSKVTQCSWPGYDKYNDVIDFETFYCKPFRSFQEINNIANEILNRYAFLNNWLLIEANWSHNNNSLKWANINYPVENWISEEHFTNDDLLGKIQNGFAAKDRVFDKERIEFNEIIPPMEGKIRPRERAPYLIENFEGLDISEASLYFLGMFLLGSLVRYRPNIWIHSLRGRHTENQPIDDKPLAIIFKFLDSSLKTFPDMILDFIMESPQNIIEDNS